MRPKESRVIGVPKQWGGKNKKQAGRVLEGRTWDEMPFSSGGTPDERRPS